MQASSVVPTLTWKNGNNGFYRMHGFDDMEITKLNTTKLELTFDEVANGPIDPARQPFRIDIFLKDAAIDTPDE